MRRRRIALALRVSHYKDWMWRGGAFVDAYYNYAPMEAKAPIVAISGGARYPMGEATSPHTLY